MKSKLIKILSITLISLLTGCSEWLNTLPPDGLVFDQFWKTKEDVESVLMGAYGQFAGMDEKLFLFGEIRADMLAEGTSTPANERQIYNGNIFPENNLTDWSDFYEIINYCNNVIKYAPEVFEIDVTLREVDMQSFMSEALAIRALAYFYLVRLYKDVPFVVEPSDNDGSDFFPEKTDGDVILDALKEDLEFAALRLKGDYGNLAENKGRFSQASVYALLGDICLWQFEYEEALKWLNLVNKDEKYFLQSTLNWFDIYNPGNSLEGILEFQFDNTLGQTNTLYDYTWIQNRYRASEYALDILDPIESLETVRGRGSISTEQRGYKIWKYCGASPNGSNVRPSSISRNANFIVYRLADVKLMQAEALSQLGRFNEALAIINEVRNRALMAPVEIANTALAFENAILLERAKELAYEGKRWFDLMRMGRRNDFENKLMLIDILVEKVPSAQKLVFANKLANPDGWYFPVYDAEIENNPNLEQNPFYQF